MLGLRWQQLFGSTSTFALRLALAEQTGTAEYGFDTQDSDVGMIEVWAGGRCLTQNRHPDWDGVATGVVWSMADVVSWTAGVVRHVPYETHYPGSIEGTATGADWLRCSVNEWMDLTLGEETDWFEKRRLWRMRHALRGISGVALPNIVFRRIGNEIEISWDNSFRDGPRPEIEWIEQRGSTRIDVADFVPTLQVAGATLAGALKGDLATDIENLATTPEKALLARLPAHLRHLDGTLVDGVLRFGPKLLAASGAGRPLSAPDVAAVTAVIDQAAQGSPGSGLPWRPVSPSTNEPWTQGYDLATEYRQSQGWGANPAPSLREHMRSCGVDVGYFDLADRHLHGLSVRGPGHRPTVRINRKSWRCGADWAEEMLLAHELCHLLHDTTGDTLSLLSGDHSDWPPEARANAFAAELLMPRDGVAKLLRGRAVDTSVVDEILARFGVGPMAATQHLRNLRVISAEDQARLYAACTNGAREPD